MVFDPFSHFKQWEPLPESPESIEDIEKQNKQYKSETIPLPKTMMELLYWTTKKEEQKVPYKLDERKKQKPENQKEKNEVDLKNMPEKIKENKYFPIIERLYNSKQISEKSFKEVLVYIKWNKDFQLGKIKIDEKEKKIIELNIKKIPWEKFEKNNEKKQNIIEWQQEKNLKEFFKDFPDKQKLIKSNKTEWFQKEVLEMVWKNYIKIETWNKEQDKKENFSTAIKTSSNNILNNSKNLNRDTETFKKAIKDIRWDDIEKQIKGLETIYIISWQAEWKLWKTENDKKSYDNKKLNLLKDTKDTYFNESKKSLKERYIKINEQLNSLVITENEREKLENEQELIIKKAVETDKEIKKTQWIFSWNKKENNENIKNPNEKTMIA